MRTVNKKDTRKTLLIFSSSVFIANFVNSSIADFEQVNTSWERAVSLMSRGFNLL